MTQSVQLTREKSEDVTHLHDLHGKLVSAEAAARDIVEVEKLIVESGEGLDVASDRQAGPTVAS